MTIQSNHGLYPEEALPRNYDTGLVRRPSKVFRGHIECDLQALGRQCQGKLDLETPDLAPL